MMTLTGKFSTYAQYSGRKSLVSRLFLFLSIWHERKILDGLDVHLLNDIGVSKNQARSEASRPIWDAPERWTH